MSDEIDLDAWPNCATPDCEHKRCLWSGTDLCFPCAEWVLGKAEMERRYEATHGQTLASARAEDKAEDELPE